MKKIALKISGIIVLGVVLLTSCNKEEYEKNSIYTRFSDVEVTFHGDNPLSVTDYKLIQPGDSLYLDFTVTSKNKGIYKVAVWEGGSGLPGYKFDVAPEDRYNYSHVLKLKMDSKVGTTSYRVWAIDSAGVYMGDGYKRIDIDIASDFYYWVGRNVFVPDSVAKTAKCYISTSTGELLSYTDGLTNSAKIDIGYLYDNRIKSISNGDTTRYGHTFYSLKASPTIFEPYDLSGFTKNETKLYSQNRNNQLSTFQRMKTAALIKSVPGNNKIVKSDPIIGIGPGYLTYFLTASGKYGGIYVNSIYRNNANNGTYMNIDIKVQK